ncbi:hypothetical protein Q3G72_032274 [Acer saccharum]|nr:hypothetical protein Q3G72_032274 [Acer saccharum]
MIIPATQTVSNMQTGNANTSVSALAQIPENDSIRSNLLTAADYLVNIGHIRIHTERYSKARRYGILKRKELFGPYRPVNAVIRPTNIKGCSEDTLFIPLITDAPDWTGVNDPFHIDHFIIDQPRFNMVMEVIKDKRTGWNILPLSGETFGRPVWLFDWHDNDVMASWFPVIGNYTMEDVTLAYIIGVACTPRLGYHDIDDWQEFPNNVQPANPVAANYNRLTPRRFYGAYEVRTLETETRLIIVPEADSTEPDRGKKRRLNEDEDEDRYQQSEPSETVPMDTTAGQVYTHCVDLLR